MSSTAVALIGIAALLILMFIKMPIGFAMGIMGFMGYAFLVSWDAAVSAVGLTMYNCGTSYSLGVLPLFVLMGQFAFRSRLSEQMFACTNKWLGRLHGGLAIATIGACAGFAAVTGSTLTGAITMGSVALPEMRKYHYDPKLALGAIASGGTLGILIPPSIAFVIYGILTEQSIGKLFLAGIVPGLLLSFLFMLTIYIIARIRPELAPQGPRYPFREKMVSLKGTWPTLLLFFIVMGGLYTGVFVPNEAAAIGASGALVIALAMRSMRFKEFWESLFVTVDFSAMIFIVIMGAMIFNVFLARSKIPIVLAETIVGLGLSKYTILVIILFLYLVLGCIMEAYSMVVLTLPVIYPVIEKLGFDPIWYGVLMVIMIEMGMITPPVGLNVFVLRGMAKDVPMYGIFKGAAPFVVAMAVCVAILIIWPGIVLFLPNMSR